MIAVGTKVQAFHSREGRTVRGVVIYAHESRNPYAADRVTYGVRWSGAGVGDGWSASDLTIIK